MSVKFLLLAFVAHLVSLTEAQDYSWQGLKPITPSPKGEYAPVDWGVLKGNLDYADMWKRRTYDPAPLHLPPLILVPELNSIAASLFVQVQQSGEGKVEVYGAFHPNYTKSITSLQVTLTITLEFTATDSTLITRKHHAVVQIEHARLDGSFPRLLTLSPIKRGGLSDTLPPRAYVSVTPPEPLDQYLYQGMTPLNTTSYGDYPVVDWSNLDGVYDQLTIWKTRKNFYWIILSAPSLMLVPQLGGVGVVLYLKMDSSYNVLLFGGYHPNVSKALAPIDVTLNVTIEFTGADESTVYRRHHLITKLTHIRVDGTHNLLVTFNQLSWNSLSETIPPRMSVSIYPSEPLDKYLYMGLAPLTPSPSGNYPTVEVGALEGLYDYKTTWRKRRDYYWVDIFTPSFILVKELGAVGAVFQVKMDSSSNVRIYGGYHPNVSNDITPVEVTLRVVLEFTAADDSLLYRRHWAVVILNKVRVDGSPDLLLTVGQLSWSSLSDNIPPRIIIDVTPVKPLERYLYMGMPPLLASPQGDYPLVEWGAVEGLLDHKTIWKKRRDFYWIELYAPSFILLPNVSGQASDIGAILYVRMDGSSNLNLYGGYHPNVSKSLAPVDVNLRVCVEFTAADESIVVRQHHIVATLSQVRVDGSSNVLLTLNKLSWSGLHDTIPPRFHVSITPVQPLDKYLWMGLTPLIPSATGGYPVVDFGTLDEGVYSYLYFWNNKRNYDYIDFHVPSLILLPEVASTAIVLTLRMDSSSKVRLYGGYHANISKSTPPINVQLNVAVDFITTDDMPVSRSVSNVVPIQPVRLDGSWNLLHTFDSLNWNTLSAAFPPRLTISVKSATR